MNIDKIKKYIPWCAVGLPIVLAVIVFIFGIISPIVLTKIFLIIAAVLLVALAAVLYFLLFALSEKRRNFFLTDPNTGKNISAQSIGFALVNDRMNLYLAERIESEKDVWEGEILTRHGIFGQHDVYRPLVAYKILFDLAEENSSRGWNAFYSMSENAFTGLTNALNSVNDNNMARRLMQLRQMKDDARLADFVVGNRRYIQGRMVIFVKSNIDMFDDIIA